MINLNISQQFGKISLDIQPVKFDLAHHKPDLEIQQIPAEMDVTLTRHDLEIDYTQMLESLGLGKMAFISRTFAQNAQQEYLVNLEQTVQIGDQVATIEKDIPIGEIFFQAQEPSPQEIELVAIAPLDIHYIPATIETTTKLGGVQTKMHYGSITVENFTFPSIKLRMEQEPYLKIESVGQVLDHSK